MKEFGSFAAGVLLTYLVLNNYFKIPEVFEIPSKVVALPHQFIAQAILEDSESSTKQRQMALAVLVSHDTEYFMEIDSTIGFAFTNKAIDNLKVRQMQLLRSKVRAYERFIDSNSTPAILNHYEKKYNVEGSKAVAHAIMIETIYKEPFVKDILTEQNPSMTEEEIKKLITDYVDL
ncbi:MAG: hypothetical protein N4A46_00645 [Schleiferiaceae bacterium]|jgi:hypothetical protein|nr:hypothetical protein [Schleiferiaceae bacterium]